MDADYWRTKWRGLVWSRATFCVSMDEARLRALFAAIEAGDPDAEVELFAGLWSRLIGVARSRGVRGPEVEDVVQDTLKAVFSQIRSGAFRRQSRPSTWVIGILRHKIADYFERVGPQARLVYDNDAATALELPARQQQRLEVIQLLQRLTPKQRVVLLGTEVEGLTYEELANALRCASGSIASTKHRAIARLRSILRDRSPVRGLPAAREGRDEDSDE